MKKTSAAVLSFYVATALCANVFGQSLTQAWFVGPGTNNLDSAGSSRQMAYNPVSGNIIHVSRPSGVLTINRLRGTDGSILSGMSTNGIAAGTIVLSAVAVADDGAIYAANVSSGAIPALKVYRWSNEAATPTLAYGPADPNNGAGTSRWGDVIAVRGSGTNTQILVSSDQTTVAILTTTNGTTFTHTKLPISGVIANFNSGLAFSGATTNSFWGRRSGNAGVGDKGELGEVLIRVAFNLETGTAAGVFTNTVVSGICGIAFDESNRLLAGITRSSAAVPQTNFLYQVSANLNTLTARSSRLFPTAFGDGGEEISAAAFGTGRVFGEVPNNGIVAWNISTVPRVTTQPVASQTVTVGDNAIMTVVAANTATYQWKRSGTNIVDGGNCSGATTASLTVNPAGGADAGNYTVVLSNGSTNAISAVSVLTVMLNQTITFGALGNRTYGDASFGLSATSSSGLPVTLSILSGPATITGGTNVTLTGAGTVIVRASQAGNADYNSAPNVDQSFSVAKAVLTVTASVTNVYGAEPVLTPTYIGFVSADNAGNSFTGAPNLSTTATTNSSVAGSPYQIIVTLGTLASDKYDLTASDGSLTVTRAALTVTANSTNRLYGTSNPTFTESYSGFVNGEDTTVLTGSLNLTTTAIIGSPAGNYVITAAQGSLAADNYAFTFVNGTLSVNKVSLTVTMEDTNRVYSATNSFTVTYSSFVNGDDASVVSGLPSFSTTAETNSPVNGSPYAVTPGLGSLTASNYDFTTFVSGNLTITKAPLIVTADLTKVYGETNPALVPLYIGFVNNEGTNVLTGAPSLSTSADTNSTVAGSPYVIIVTTNTLAADNYDITSTNGTLAVSPANLTVTANSTNRLYGASNPAFTGSVVGLQNGDDISASYTTVATAASAVGGYAITQTLSDPSGKLPNYTVTTNNGILTITGAALSITSDSTNRVYGSSNPTFTGSLVGLQNGDNISAVYGTSATTNSFVGNYFITQTLVDPDMKIGNYVVTTNDGLLSVTAASLTVSANSTNRGVGQSNPIFTGNIVGLQNNDNITANYTSVADTNSAAGTYPIVPEFQDPDGKLGNYAVTTNNGTLTVDGPPAITLQPSSLMVGAGSNAVFSVTASGTSLSYQWRKGATDLVDGGNISGATSASLTLSGVTQADASSNYTIFISNSSSDVTSSAVSLTVIDPPMITVQPASQTNVVGSTATFSVSATGTAPLQYQWRFEGVDIAEETASALSLLEVQTANAGSYTVVITNFAGSVTSAPAVLSVHYILTTSAALGGTVVKNPDQASYAPGSSVELTATAATGFAFSGWSGDANGTSNPFSVTMSGNKTIAASFVGPGSELILDNTNAAVTFVGTWFTNNLASGKYGADYRFALVTNAAVTARATYRPEILRAGNYDVYIWYPQLHNRSTNAQWLVSHDGGSVAVSVNQRTNGGGWRLIAAEKAFLLGTNGFVRLSNNTGESGTNTFVMADAVRFVYSANQGTPPTIVTQPQSQTINQGNDVTFTVEATGVGTLAYQWRFNNEPITGATGTNYTRTNIQPSHAGNYSVCVMHDGGSAISSNAVLSINIPPTITTQPVNKTVTAGQAGTFAVSATGTGPLAYQWRFEANDIAGATASSYALVNILAEQAGNYSVVVSNLAGVVTSANALLTVNADLGNPTVSIVYPASNGKVSTANITMTGRAKDAIGISAVKYLFNGVTNTATGTTNWSASLTLTPGTNVVVAWCLDPSGNESSRVTRTFFYNSTNFLVLNINGTGKVTGVVNGQGLLVGRPYKATASVGPGTNFLFTNWTGSVTSTNLSLSFIMESNMVLNANFITNPFTAVAGSYNGLFFETNEIAHHSSGFFTLKLTSKAAYSGKLLLDGNSVSFSGKFDLSGQSTRTLLRTKLGKTSLDLSLELDWSTTNETIHGTVTDGIWVAKLQGDRAVHDTIYNPNTNFVGRYTFILPTTNGPVEAPGGHSYGLVTNTAAGMISLAGALGDGAPLSQKVSMSKFGQWPLYVPAYKSPTVYPNGGGTLTNVTELRGAILGWVRFTNAPTRTLAGTVSWIKTELPPTNTFYPYGFTNQIELIASAYTAPTPGTRILNLPNANFILDDGNLVFSLTNAVILQANNSVIISTNDHVKLSFNLGTGLLRGTFLHPYNTNASTAFYGAVLQSQNYGAGYFKGTNESGSMLIQ